MAAILVSTSEPLVERAATGSVHVLVQEGYGEQPDLWLQFRTEEASRAWFEYALNRMEDLGFEVPQSLSSRYPGF